MSAVNKQGSDLYEWLRYVQITDRVDVHNRYGSGWTVRTVSKIESWYGKIKKIIFDNNCYVNVDLNANLSWQSLYSSKIAKLNTFTHNKCGLSKELKICTICNEKCCGICGDGVIEFWFGSKWIYHCKNCSLKIEKRDIFNSIYKAFQNIDNNVNNVNNDIFIHIITDYSIGFEVKCCNKSCDNFIVFDSKYQFLSYKNNQCNEIYYYKVYVNNHTIANNTAFSIYGITRRIFCSLCTTNKIYCAFKCGNYDIDNYKLQSLDIICLNHPFCIICNQMLHSGTKCIKCHNYFDSHGYQCGVYDPHNYCKNCIIMTQTGKMIKLLTRINIPFINYNDD
eukprot:143390_1